MDFSLDGTLFETFFVIHNYFPRTISFCVFFITTLLAYSGFPTKYYVTFLARGTLRETLFKILNSSSPRSFIITLFLFFGSYKYPSCWHCVLSDAYFLPVRIYLTWKKYLDSIKFFYKIKKKTEQHCYTSTSLIVVHFWVTFKYVW